MAWTIWQNTGKTRLPQFQSHVVHFFTGETAAPAVETIAMSRTINRFVNSGINRRVN